MRHESEELCPDLCRGDRARAPRRWKRLVTAMAFGPVLGCMFDPADAEGLDCYSDEDCGPKLQCRESLCTKPGDDSSASIGGSSSDSADADDGPGSNSGGPSGGTGPAPPCPYTNNGDCDEPEGTNLCPEGTDVVDCSDNHGPACVDPGYDCTNATCCNTALCVNFTSLGTLCTDQCSLGKECNSCCCGTTDDGNGVCAPSDFCEGTSSECRPGSCGLGGSRCWTDSDCCNGRCLENLAGQTTCFKTCTANSQCRSGCCADGFCQGANAC